MSLIFGRLSWDAIPFHEPILLGTFIAVALGGVAVLRERHLFRSGACSGVTG